MLRGRRRLRVINKMRGRPMQRPAPQPFRVAAQDIEAEGLGGCPGQLALTHYGESRSEKLEGAVLKPAVEIAALRISLLSF